MARWSPIPLRLIVGYGFMEHGFAKLYKGPDAFAAILQGMGVPDPSFMAWFTILIELLGGLAVILGAFVTIVSVPMAVVLLVAMFKVHLPYGFSSLKLIALTATGAKFGPPGYEVNLLYMACLAALVISGSGPFAIDGLIGKRCDAIANRSQRVEIMCDHEDGEAERLLECPDQRIELARGDRVESGGRLIQKQEGGIKRQRTSQCHALGHAS